MEALLAALARCAVAPAVAVRAVYVVLVYTTGFVAWEIPRTGPQAEEAYSRSWRRLLADSGRDEYPLTTAAADDLVGVADEQQFDYGLIRLAHGLFPTSWTTSPSGESSAG